MQRWGWLVAAVLATACTSDTDDTRVVDTAACEGITPRVTDLTPDQLLAMLDAKDFELINVHIPYAGEIAGTDENIPYNETDDLEEWLGYDLDAKVVLYCLTGPMSEIAANDLVDLGYCNVHDMPAGMSDWEDAGYPMAR